MSETIRVIEEFGDGGDQLLLNPSGTLVGVFTYTRDAHNKHTLAIHSAADGQLIAGPLRLGDCRGLAFVDDETLIIANERKLLRWKVPSEPEAFGSPGGFVYALAARPGLPVFGIGVEESISAVDLGTGKRLWSADTPPEMFTDSLALSPGGRLLASDHSPNRSSWRMIAVFEVATGRRLRLHLSEDDVRCLTFAPDENSLFTFTGEPREKLAVYQAGDVDPTRSFALPRSMRSGCTMTFAPDGSWLDVVDYVGAWFRLDPQSGKVLQRRKPPTAMADYSQVVVSANGKVAASVAEDRSVVVWPTGSDEVG